jgi:hypothetical protein
MRRMICLLPALALVACQSEVPTDLDGVQMSAGSPATAGLQAIIQDWIVETPDEVLEFVVVNPPTDCYWSRAKLSTRPHPASELPEVLANALHVDFCTLEDHWEPLTGGDDEPDLKVHFLGEDVCEALAEPGTSPVTLEAKLMVGDPDRTLFQVIENFIVKCPYLDD